MPDEAVTRWQQRGNIYLWQYPNRNKRGWFGWNISCDVAGAASIGELVALLLASPHPSRRRLQIASFESNRFDLDEARFANDFTLVHPHTVAPESWQLTHENGNVSLILGTTRLREFGESITGVLQWRQDYALRPAGELLPQDEADAQSLWFWTTATL